jgi:hypothetical protein
MTDKRRNPIVALALVASAMIVNPTPGSSQGAESAPAVDPTATAELDRMGKFLRSLQAFQVEADTARDEVLDNGLKKQVNGTASVLARRNPERLRAEVTTDWSDRLFLYDGKSFTLYANRLHYYATVPAPPTIRELVDTLQQRYDVLLPMADLFRWGDTVSSETITAAVDLGPSTVDGVTCEHYAFRQEGLDWQIWIQLGDFPLPKRLILTTTTDEARPQYTVTYRWNLAPSMNEAAFVFNPPAGAQRIVFAEMK